MGLQKVKIGYRGYKGLKKFTEIYKGLQGVTGAYRGLQKITMGYRGLQRVTGVTTGNRAYRRLKWVTVVTERCNR